MKKEKASRSTLGRGGGTKREKKKKKKTAQPFSFAFTTVHSGRQHTREAAAERRITTSNTTSRGSAQKTLRLSVCLFRCPHLFSCWDAPSSFQSGCDHVLLRPVPESAAALHGAAVLPTAVLRHGGAGDAAALRALSRGRRHRLAVGRRPLRGAPPAAPDGADAEAIPSGALFCRSRVRVRRPAHSAFAPAAGPSVPAVHAG